MNLAIVGYGKMGRLIEAMAPKYGFNVQLRLNRGNNGVFEALTKEHLNGIDVAVEFSNAQAAPESLKRLARAGVATVTGTTGWFDRLPDVSEAVENAGSGLVWSSNFSVGIHVFTRIVSEAARLLANQEEYDAWAWEIHHAAKRDAPSGTLLSLIAKIKDTGYQRHIDTACNRAGSQAGSHEIGFDSLADTITLRHVARSRESYARGALRAARWVTNKRGIFDFSEIISELG